MELNEYQKLAAVTRNKKLELRDERLNYALGLGESGELQNVVKKHLFHGHSEEEAKAKVLDESGDTLWYIATLLEVYGLTLEDAAQHNVAKLRERYPEGFSEERSINRTA